MPRGGRREASEGKRIGRPEKPKIEQFADKGIASRVLGQNGAPVHARKCECEVCVAADKKELRCECQILNGAKPGEELKIQCSWCRTREDHAVCRCEECGWWELLRSHDRRLVFETRRYLTDRRDGKPAQGVFVGDTREASQPLTRGSQSSYFEAPTQPSRTHKPN